MEVSLRVGAVRVALAVVVVTALVWVGVTTGQRVLDRRGSDEALATPEGLSDAWVAATLEADVDGLVALASDRVDQDVLRTTHEAVLPVLEGVEVEVEAVQRVDGPQDNEAVATLAWSARPGASEGTWTWTSELELIRARGTWSTDWTPTAIHPQLRPGWSFAVEEQPPARAPILDREGRALSPSGSAVEIGVQPGRLPDASRLLGTIASVLPEALAPLQALLERDDLEPDWYYPLVTVDAARADEAWPDLVALPGLLRREAEGGVGRAVAAPELVGTVEETEDGGRRGTSGLEAAYDDQLTGSATTEVRLVDPEGTQREAVFTFQADPAPPLVTTLDRDVQRAVDDAVLTVDDPVGVVVLDVASGGIVAVASRPVTGYPRALEGRYPPAAVAGIVPLTATLAQGASLGDELLCPDAATVGGVRVTTRTAPPAAATLADALTGGCDVALARQALAVGDEALRDAVTTLGLDVEVELPVPARGWSWPAADTDAALASWGVGHGQVEASALGAAQLAATVARGAPVRLTVLADEAVPATDPLPQALVTGLREAMRRAGALGPVQVDGTRIAGLAARSGQVSGDPAPATGWWVGFLEGSGPDVAIAVVVEQGDDARAATIATRVAREVVAGAG